MKKSKNLEKNKIVLEQICSRKPDDVLEHSTELFPNGYK